MNYISPIKRHSGYLVLITQKFGVNTKLYAQFKDEKGNPLKGHNGIDLALSLDAVKSYGTNLNTVCDGKVSILVWDNPMSKKGNGVYVDSTIETGSDGAQRFQRWVYWHMMDIDVKIGQTLKMGENIGDMGNSGWVFPEPTVIRPYNGTHLHLGCYPYIYKDGNWRKEFPDNGFDGAVDPLPLIKNFNPPNWEVKDSLDNIWDRLNPIRWAIELIKIAFTKVEK